MKIRTEALHHLIDFEPFILVTLLILLSYGFYKLFLKDASHERHISLGKQYKLISKVYQFLVGFFISYLLLFELSKSWPIALRASLYIGLSTFLIGAWLLVRTSRILLLQYLFLGSMRAGVPLLVVNIFSLILSFAIALWGLSYFFGIDLGPILATSAALSIVLGLALQDTLGNLFAGISLQMDRSFEIGDWLEVFIGGQKTVGQVSEISWRSTTLIGWTNEVIHTPNRTLASAQIYNFKKGELAIYRSQVFKLPYGVDLEKVRKILLDSIKSISGVRHDMAVICYISENHESWIGFKIAYAIDDYSTQFYVSHSVVEAGLNALYREGYQVAYPHLVISHHSDEPLNKESY